MWCPVGLEKILVKYYFGWRMDFEYLIDSHLVHLVVYLEVHHELGMVGHLRL